MALYHLSHTDGDGLTCSYLVEKAFNQQNSININGKTHTDLTQFNADYSELEMSADETVFDSIFSDIKFDNQSNPTLLITDLNFKSVEDASVLEIKAKKYGVELILIDHHDSGKEVAKAKDWYHLDDTKSASLQTFMTLKEWAQADILKEYKDFVAGMNDYDIYANYLSDDFLKGELINSLTRDIKNTLPYTNSIDDKQFNYSIIREYTFFVYTKLSKAISDKKAIIELPLIIEQAKKQFINEYVQNSIVYLEKDIKNAEEAADFVEINLKAEDVVDNKNLSTREKLQMLFYIYEDIEPQKLNNIEKKMDNVTINTFGLEKSFIREIERLVPNFDEEKFKETDFYKYLHSKNVTLSEANEKFEDFLINLSIIEQKKSDFDYKNEQLNDTKNEDNLKLRKFLYDNKDKDVPARLRLQMLNGPQDINNHIKDNIPYKKGKINIISDVNGGLFQQGSYILANHVNTEDIFISVSPKGFIGVRASNGLAAQVAGFLGGGGHPNAGGANISSYIPKELLSQIDTLRKEGGNNREQIVELEAQITSHLIEVCSTLIEKSSNNTNSKKQTL